MKFWLPLLAGILFLQSLPAHAAVECRVAEDLCTRLLEMEDPRDEQDGEKTEEKAVEWVRTTSSSYLSAYGLNQRGISEAQAREELEEKARENEQRRTQALQACRAANSIAPAHSRDVMAPRKINPDEPYQADNVEWQSETRETWHKTFSRVITTAISRITRIVPPILLDSGILLIGWSLMSLYIMFLFSRMIFTGDPIEQVLPPVGRVCFFVFFTGVLAGGGQEWVTRMTVLAVSIGVTANHAISEQMNAATQQNGGVTRFSCTGDGQDWDVIEAGIFWIVSEAMDLLGLGVAIAATAIPYEAAQGTVARWFSDHLPGVVTTAMMLKDIASASGMIMILRLIIGIAIAFYAGKIAITLLSKVAEVLVAVAIQLCIFPIVLIMSAFQSTRGALGLLPKAAGQVALSFLMIAVTMSIVKYFAILGTQYYIRAVYGLKIQMNSIPDAVNSLVGTHMLHTGDLFGHGSTGYVGAISILAAFWAANAVVLYSFQIAAEIIQGPMLETGGLQKLGQAAAGVGRGLRNATLRARR